jgi:hypothetical protein
MPAVTSPASLPPETRPRVSPSVYARPFGAELVLLDFGRGEYFGLDEIGAEIWRRLEAGASLADIAAVLVSTYDVSDEEAYRDVVALVTEMHERHLVTLS